MKYKWMKTIGPFAFILGLLIVVDFGTAIDGLTCLLILCSVVLSAVCYGCVKLLEMIDG